MARTDKFHPARNGKKRSGTRNRSFDAVLSRNVTVNHNGERVELPAEEAFLLQLRNRARSKDASAAQLLAEFMDAFSEIEELSDLPITIRRIIVAPGSVSSQLEILRIGKKFERYSEAAYILLEPWIVQAALARLDRRLTIDEQRTVLAATRTPHKVQWPSWWEANRTATP